MTLFLHLLSIMKYTKLEKQFYLAQMSHLLSLVNRQLVYDSVKKQPNLIYVKRPSENICMYRRATYQPHSLSDRKMLG